MNIFWCTIEMVLVAIFIFIVRSEAHLCDETTRVMQSIGRGKS